MTNRELVLEVLKMAGFDNPAEKEGGGITFRKDRWGYVLGGQGELYTQALARQWGSAKRAGKSASYFLTDAKRWYTPPRRVVDCSGMIVQAIRSQSPGYGDRTADTFKEQFAAGGAIGKLPETAGTAVWKPGHIGIYLGGGKVCECRGVNYGVVISDIKTQKWTHYGKLRDVQYDDAYTVFQTVKPVVYTVKKGDTLYAIAARNSTTVDALVRLNNIKNPSRIYVGQQITIREGR